MKRCCIENTDDATDPTMAAELQTLLKKTLADNKTQDLLADLKDKRVGLILSGGGGKGAYQAGVILALYDCGINHFSSIAGTSVGGLNGVLCHEVCRSGNRDLILEIWGKMSFKSVLGFSIGLFIKFFLYVIQSLRIFVNMKRMAHEIAGRVKTDPELHSFCDFLISAFFSICHMAFIFLTAVSVWFVVKPYLFSEFGLTELNVDVKDAPFIIFTGFLPFYILPIFANACGRFFSLFSNDPIRRIIEALNIDMVCDGKPPVICTLAEEVEPWAKSPWDSYTHRPFYEPLNKLPNQRAVVDVLLQTAALPEVFPINRFGGLKAIVDGGMADNTPIFGAFFGECDQRPDTLIVVYLDHRFSRIDDLRRWEIRRLRSILQSMKGNEDSEMMCWARTVTNHMIAIIPSKPLGDLICGTLNFSPTKSRCLMELGYGDTLRQLLDKANGAPRTPCGRSTAHWLRKIIF